MTSYRCSIEHLTDGVVALLNYRQALPTRRDSLFRNLPTYKRSDDVKQAEAERARQLIAGPSVD